MENPIEMDDLGVPLFLETPIYPKQPFVAIFHCSNRIFRFVLIAMDCKPNLDS